MKEEEMEATKEQKNAIKSLERAFKKCHSLGLKFAGYDYSLLWATKEACEYAEEHGQDYAAPAAAQNLNECNYSCGTVNDYGSYTDSGGI